jgi:hypothetical protein
MARASPLWPAASGAILHYAVAVLAVAAAVVAGLAADRLLHTAPFVSLFLCAILFAAWRGGPTACATPSASEVCQQSSLNPRDRTDGKPRNASIFPEAKSSIGLGEELFVSQRIGSLGAMRSWCKLRLKNVRGTEGDPPHQPKLGCCLD